MKADRSALRNRLSAADGAVRYQRLLEGLAARAGLDGRPRPDVESACREAEVQERKELIGR